MSLITSDPAASPDTGRQFKQAADVLPHILWTAQSDGQIDYLSAAYTDYTGLEHKGDYQTWLDALHPDDVERCKAAWENAVRIGKNHSIEFRAIHHASGQYRWQAVNAQPVRDADGQITKWYGICIDIHDTLQAKDQATALAGRLQTTLECMSDAFFTLDHEWRFTYLNSAAERELRCSSEELLGRPIWEKYPQQENEHFYRQYRRALAGNCAVRFEEFDSKLNKWFELNAHPSELGLSIYFRDITERKQAALDLERTSRGLRMLSRANAALVRIDDEAELLQEICQVALEGGDYRAAWAGIAQDDEARSIKVSAWSGDEGVAHYIKNLKLSWLANTPLGQGPTGRAIREDKPILFSDTLNDPDFAPWRDAAEQSHYLSGVCLPLRDKRGSFGVLVLVNFGKRTMSEDEVRLLQELAENLGFGIAHIRAQQAQRKIEAAVVKVAASISNSSGTEFFRSLAVSMVEALGARGAFLSCLLNDDLQQARVIAGIQDGRQVGNIHYDIKGTPCECVLETGTHIVEAGIFREFPRMADAMPADLVACAGQRLDDAQGKPLGTLFVVFGERIDHPDFIRSVMQIFAARAAAEIERQQKDAQIHYQASLIDKARDAIVARDIDHRIIFWNKGAERMYGWRREEVLGRRESEVLCESEADYREVVEQVLTHGKWNGEQIKRHRDGGTVIVDGSWTLVTDEQNQPQSIFSIHTDISGRKAAENEIQRLAFYDQLTCLPNRQLLRDRLLQAIRGSARTQRLGALMFLDLDNFKELNDVYGHHRGDLLLQQVAERLTDCVRSHDTVARLGGDEFVLVVAELSEEPLQAGRQAEHIAEKVRVALTRGYEIERSFHISTPSIGVVLFDGSNENIDELLKCADLAMYKAKAAGPNVIRFYDPEMQAAVIEKVALEADLRESIEKNLFTLHYQPQLDSQNRIIGVEALVRWMHPSRIGVPPSVFIPLAEETRLIVGVGRRVMEQACRQLALWAGNPSTSGLTLAVNVSARQFHHPDFVSDIMNVVRESGIDASKLKLELTESVLVEDVTEAAAKMVDLQNQGIGFSLDDFGTGYSSLSYLRRLPLEQLKIDKSFIAEVPGNENDVSIVEAIIALGRKMGLSVIAEGVETSQQRDFLCNIGCHAYQGYFFSRPLAAEDFSLYLQKHPLPIELKKCC